MARRERGGGRGRGGGGAARRGAGPRGRSRAGRGRGSATPADVQAVLQRQGRLLLSPARIAARLGLGRGSHKAVRAALRRLESEGRVERVRGRFRLRRSDGLLEGRLERGRGRGGRVVDETGGVWRVADAGEARDGDRVAIGPWGAPDDRRADLLHVVEGARDHWVGILHVRGRLAWATPYRDDGPWSLRVARPDRGGAADGDVVRLEPAPPRGRRARQGDAGDPWAVVTARLGRPGEPDADAAAVIWRHRLPGPFDAALEEAARERAAEPLEAELARRVDLRDLDLVTIDPADARDHDDAVAVSARGAEIVLHVAIADVSHFVAAGSALDREALRRGTSVYFPDRVIPMLPEALSSGACSLRPDEDRLALVVELGFDADARVVRRGFQPAVVRSRARLAYEEAAAVMAGEREHAQQGPLRALAGLTERLLARRRRRGAIDLDLRASAIRLDARRLPVDVFPEPRTLAHRAVEEAMLAANRAVAELLVEAEVPAIFRNHEPPAESDLEALAARLRSVGLLDRPGALSRAALARAVDAADPEQAAVVHPLVLRAMRQARYGAACAGHYALAFESYLHFTSPIRRYPDLVVHRVLKALLAGDDPPLDGTRAQRIAVRCSFRERLAERADRERRRLTHCVFLRDRVGECFEGRVTGVARHGLYVTLDPWPIDGLVHVSALPEFVTLDEEALALVAEGSGRRYVLGDRLEVALVSVDVVEARIDLEIRRTLEPSPLRAGGRAQGRRRR